MFTLLEKMYTMLPIPLMLVHTIATRFNSSKKAAAPFIGTAALAYFKLISTLTSQTLLLLRLCLKLLPGEKA